MKRLLTLTLALVILVSFAVVVVGCGDTATTSSTAATEPGSATTATTATQSTSGTPSTEATATSATTSAGPAKELKVGVALGLSGSGSESLALTADGVTAAADWINEKGGLTINGEKYIIKPIIEDIKMTSDGTTAAANKLVFDDKVSFIIGPPIPPYKAALSAITEPNKVLRIDTSGPGSPGELGSDKPYTFATMVSAAVQGMVFDQLVVSYPQVKTVALICPEDPGAIEMLTAATKLAEAHGLKVVAEEHYPFGTDDFYPVLTKLLASKPDVVYQGAGFASWIGSILKQARELGFEGPVIDAASPGDLYVIRDVAGKYATDFLDSNYDLSSAEMTPMIKEIRSTISAKFHVDAKLEHILGWEALWALTQGIEKAQSLDSTAVKNALETMDSIETPFGTGKMEGSATYGVNHVLVRPAALATLMNGEAKHVKWVTPVLP